MPAGLLALAIGGFGIGLTEFVIMGLLPEVAADFAVNEAAAGWFISGYALSVVVGALLVTAAVTSLPRKPVLMALLVLFIAGNFLSAIADSYAAMLLGRVIAALCHGAFFGIGSVVAASLVPAHKKAGAIAIMFTGLTAANVLGVPFGTFLGQNLGWRSTFWAITVIGVIALLGIAFLVPSTAAAAPSGGLRTELGAFASGQIWLSIIVTILGFGGMFGAFTYIAFTLTEVSGFDAGLVPWLLVLFGAGLFVGNFAGGKGADRALDKSLVIILAGLVVVLIFFALTATSPVATVFSLALMGGFGFATVPGLQTRVMKFACSAPTLASGANIGAFNLGNAMGAWVGGLTISMGLGYTSPIWAGAIITAAALAVMLVAASAVVKSSSRNGGVTETAAAATVDVEAVSEHSATEQALGENAAVR
ncbi:MFS transporter [Arthrobacter sp. ISL-30]|uniref:MFS transporter n=1 Tax=Arthrobacter sp. ISL-30 TaxID=2819109 RepID=UPI001BE57B6E|nr:MFS transporter [Arthrobacter sp. ISL-30]MBT2512043.1 MFS transporter [Arthrobacter sp. ISL-30]